MQVYLIYQHDGITNDDTSQGQDTKFGHKTKRCVENYQSQHNACYAKRCCTKNDKQLADIFQLQHQEYHHEQQHYRYRF